MSVTKLHERLEQIECAYFAALDGRYPETVPPSIWRQAILDAVPDVTIEEIIQMFHWRARKAARGDGPATGMCEGCAIRVAPLICTRAIAPEDCICCDKCADALDRWAHPFGSKSNAAPCLYPFQRVLELARGRRREESDLSRQGGDRHQSVA